jgi:hypothetical protein
MVYPMLVYFKEPMCFIELDGYRIYGRKYAYGTFGSTDIPLELYNEKRHLFVDAEYTPQWLERRFGKKFPPITFTAQDLYSLEDARLAELAITLGVQYHYRKSVELSTRERHALRKSIISFLNRRN